MMKVPNPVAIVVGSILGAYYYSHRDLNTLFAEHGAPGDPPEGNCGDKCVGWLKRASSDPNVDAVALLGGVLEEFMEVDTVRSFGTADEHARQRKRVTDILARHGLSYRRGGVIMGGTVAAPTRSLHDALRSRDLSALDIEFERALENVEKDPPAAVTAACAIIEALCKVYVESEGLDLPSEQTVKPLWRTVQKHIGFDPAQIEDDDLKRVLAGLSSIVDGLGAFRTHVGSAHGRGQKAYRPAPRHARLALHSAHSFVTFVLETWDLRKVAKAG